LIGLRWSRPALTDRIEQRVMAMVAAGLVDEVARLHASGLSRTAGQALGYKELLEHLDGTLTLDEAIDLAIRRTGRFARRQWAWFRRDPRIQWLEAPADEAGNLLVDALEAAVGS
jgi:tRNA dimethylallyltransferase